MTIDSKVDISLGMNFNLPSAVVINSSLRSSAQSLSFQNALAPSRNLPPVPVNAKELS